MISDMRRQDDWSKDATLVCTILVYVGSMIFTFGLAPFLNSEQGLNYVTTSTGMEVHEM